MQGFPNSDLWSLDYTIAKFTHPRLIKFKEYTMTYASSAGFTPETWNEALDKMIWSMEYIIQDTGHDDMHPSISCINYRLCKGGQITKEKWIQLQEDDDAKVEEGLVLFGKHFRCLWS